MKVKIGDEIYDSADEPIMIVLSKGEKEQIANMSPDCSKYCVYPVIDENTHAEIEKWMDRW